MRTAPVRCSGGLRTVAAAEPGEGWTSFRDAVDSGKGCVVLDPSRPGFPAAAEHAVDAAVRAGRVSPGHLVLFTSGTTSRPRAVHRTLASWERAVAPFTQLTGIGATDRVWVPGSLSSTLFLFGAFHAHRVGADLLLTSQPAGRASAVHCVPAQLPAILAEHQAGRLPALTTVVCAGDRLAEAVAARVVSRGLRLVRYYGAAELSFVAAGLGDGPLYPFPGVEVTVREGVLWSRSRLHALGYLDPTDPGPFRRDGHGWATVGDLGEVIPEPASGRQQVVVRGRGEAAVTVAGHTVVVADVEQVLLGVAGVADVAVLGLPHRRLGQLLAAVVVPAAGFALQESALREAVAGLPPACRPRRWRLLSALPTTAAGKVDRQALVGCFADSGGPVDPQGTR